MSSSTEMGSMPSEPGLRAVRTEWVAKLPLELAKAQGEFEPPKRTKKARIPGKEGKAGYEYCVAPDTRVLMADLSWSAAEKLAEGDRIVAFDDMPQGANRCRRWRSATVDRAAPVVLPSYRVELSDGTELISSGEHRWLTINSTGFMQWRRTDELATSEHKRATTAHASRLVRVLDPWEEDRSWETGYLAAAFDGEGHLTQTNIAGRSESFQLHLVFSQRQNVMLRLVEAICTSAGFEMATTHGPVVSAVRVSGGRSEVVRFLGQIRPRRLLERFDAERLGTLRCHRAVEVVKVEPIGPQSLVGLRTSTGTFIAEGFASHNSYADLADLVAAVQPSLTKYGIAWTQDARVEYVGDRLAVTVATRLYLGNEVLEFGPLMLPVGQATPQGIGSAITYAKRYALSSALGVPSEADDDGQAAGQTPGPQALSGVAARLVTQRQMAAMHAAASIKGVTHEKLHDWVVENYGVESVKQLTREQHAHVMEKLDALPDKESGPEPDAPARSEEASKTSSDSLPSPSRAQGADQQAGEGAPSSAAGASATKDEWAEIEKLVGSRREVVALYQEFFDHPKSVKVSDVTGEQLSLLAAAYAEKQAAAPAAEGSEQT